MAEKMISYVELVKSLELAENSSPEEIKTDIAKILAATDKIVQVRLAGLGRIAAVHAKFLLEEAGFEVREEPDTSPSVILDATLQHKLSEVGPLNLALLGDDHKEKMHIKFDSDASGNK